MNEIVQRAIKAVIETHPMGGEQAERIARAVIKSLRDLPEEPGPRYTAGEYSRKTQEAMVDEALGK